MKRLFVAVLLVTAWLGAWAQGAKNTLELYPSSFAAVQSDALSGVAIDKIGLDLSRRPCARIKMHVNRMTRAEIEGLEVKPIGGNVIVMRREVAAEGNGLIVELTAKSPTRFYLHHDKYGDSNEVSLDLEPDKEYRLEAQLNLLLSIVVASNVKGADVYVDDIFKGTVGDNFMHTVENVTPGEHKIALKQGASTAERTIDVNSNNISFRLEINTATSRPQYVVFELHPKDAILFIDNKPCSTREGFAQTVLQNGTYSYRVMASGYHEQTGTFTVSGAKVERKVSLKADAAMVTLSAGADAEIWVNNELKGPSPWRGELLSGTYIFEARRAGHLTTSLSQTITSTPAEQSYTLDAPTPIRGSVDISSVPAMADVYIDGKAVGRTPLVLDLLVGEHKVELRREGYVSKTQSIVVAEGKSSSLNIELREGAKTYKVGDLYDDGKKRGVVFEVSADGRHGKIVSLQVSKSLLWASTTYEQERLIGASDKYDGAKNMAVVKQIADWRAKYPAFAWCADLGEGWYLPAIEELKVIYGVKRKINKTLANNNGTAKIDSWYWSSTEYHKFCAWNVNMHNGNTDNDGYNKNDYNYVRAVSAF